MTNKYNEIVAGIHAAVRAYCESVSDIDYVEDRVGELDNEDLECEFSRAFRIYRSGC